MGQVSLTELILLIGISLLSYLLRMIKFYSILSISDQFRIIQQSGWKRYLVSVYFFGFCMVFVPGKLGELARLPLLKRLGISYSDSTTATFIDRVIDVGLVGGLGMLVLLEFIESPVWVLASLMTLLIILFLAFKTVGLNWHGRLSGVHDFLLNSKAFLLCFLKSKKLYLALCAGLCSWGLQGFGLWVILSYLGVEFSIFLIIGIYSASLIIGMISLIPGGIGVTEASISALLVYFGIDLEIAVAAAILSRLTTFWLSILVGYISSFNLKSLIKE